MEEKTVRIYSAVLRGIDAYLVALDVTRRREHGIKFHGGRSEADDQFGRELFRSHVIDVMESLNLEQTCGFEVHVRSETHDVRSADIANFGLPFCMAVQALSRPDMKWADAVEDVFAAGEVHAKKVGTSTVASVDRSIRGSVPMAQMADAYGFKKIMLPQISQFPDRMFGSAHTVRVSCLNDAMTYLEDFEEQDRGNDFAFGIEELSVGESTIRAMEIAVAGRHHMLLCGPPKSGKTMTARRLTTLFPRMHLADQMEIASIYSAAGILGQHQSSKMLPPFRSPHHTISSVALLGSRGDYSRPGEVTLAHGGVLYLDEFSKFREDAVYGLLGAMEVGYSHSTGMPAEALVVAEVRTGRKGDVLTYEELDDAVFAAFPLQVQIGTGGCNLRSEDLRRRVRRAQMRQRLRWRWHKRTTEEWGGLNGDNGGGFVADKRVLALIIDLNREQETSNAGAILQIARTIADLEGSHEVLSVHVERASEYRVCDEIKAKNRHT